MIKLKRGAKPEILEQKAEEWAREFVEHEGPRNAMPDSKRYRYRHPDVKDGVIRDSRAKCIYCESHVTQVHPGEIEHLLPSSKRPELVVDWDNLGFVCTECNREKLDYYEPSLPLINPFEDDPAEHLAFFGPMILQRSRAPRGELTVRLLKLNDRKALFERRKERIEQLQLLLDRIEKEDQEPLRELLEAALEAELSEDNPYVAVGREFVRQARS